MSRETASVTPKTPGWISGGSFGDEPCHGLDIAGLGVIQDADFHGQLIGRGWLL